MTRLSLAECCRVLSIDPKTLRQWLSQTQIAVQNDPANAKIKCLEVEQVQTLAHLHGRLLQPEAGASDASSTSSQVQSPMALCALSDSNLQARLVQMEAQIATLQTQLTDLTLQLLREREQHAEQRLQALETQLSAVRDEAVGSVLSLPEMPAFARHPTEKPHRLVPLIEYGAKGQYVLIRPEEGELAITPDSPEWFAWLASLSSFRFVGKLGRFSARRGYNRGPNRCWYAQRTIHQQFHGKYLGVSEHITTERLEEVAAHFQAYLK